MIYQNTILNKNENIDESKLLFYKHSVCWTIKVNKSKNLFITFCSSIVHKLIPMGI